jgi:hypothetical protein
MFYTSESQILILKRGVVKRGAVRICARRIGAAEDGPVNPDTLKQHCLESASLWVLKRRANRPHMRPQSLPVVARGG